jgi:hypothetical protein
LIRDIRLDPSEASVSPRVLEISQPSSGEVVQGNNIMSFRQQQIRQVAADESRRPGNQTFHSEHLTK